MASKFFGVQITRPTSGRATALGAICAAALVALLYWTELWGFRVDLTVKVLLSVSVLWVYVTAIFGVRVTDGWRPVVLYLARLIAINAVAWVICEALSTR
jgi:hypothetical protein